MLKESSLIEINFKILILIFELIFTPSVNSEKFIERFLNFRGQTVEKVNGSG